MTAAGRDHVGPSAVVLDSRTLQSSPESGGRAGYDEAKRRKGPHRGGYTRSPAGPARDPADEQDRAQVGALAKAVQAVSGKHVELAYVDQGYTGEKPAAVRHKLKLEVLKRAEAKRGFVLLPRRWVVERTFAWAARFRRLSRDYERLASTLAVFSG